MHKSELLTSTTLAAAIPPLLIGATPNIILLDAQGNWLGCTCPGNKSLCVDRRCEHYKFAKYYPQYLSSIVGKNIYLAHYQFNQRF
jgi:hypothetical protein